jgi:hypothetical protein
MKEQSADRQPGSHVQRRPYCKPAVLSEEELEAMAAVCTPPLGKPNTNDCIQFAQS